MNDYIIIEPETFGPENNYIQEICFSEKSLKAKCSVEDAEKAKRLQQRIYALREIYDTDVNVAGNKQNFEVELDGKNVVVSGNLFNAFNLMKEKKLISSALFKSVNGHPDVSAMLEKSKCYIAKDENVGKGALQQNNFLSPKPCNIL